MSVTLSAHGRQVVRQRVAAEVKRLVREGADYRSLAERFHVTPNAVRWWSDSRGYPNYSIASRLCETLGLDPSTGEPRR